MPASDCQQFFFCGMTTASGRDPRKVSGCCFADIALLAIIYAIPASRAGMESRRPHKEARFN